MSSTYSHADRAGNRGDAWKHAVLLSVVDGLVAGTGARVLRYLETHSGRGMYRLAPGGPWRNGAGRLEHGPAGHPYVRLALSHVRQGRYPGSWMLVRQRLAEHGVAGRVQLHDTSPQVAADVREHLRRDGLDDVRFHDTDGFAAGLGDSDLVLIDPPYVPDAPADWRRAAELLGSTAAAALAWYPLLADPLPVADSGLLRAELHWDAVEGSTMRGCGVAAAGAAAGPLAAAWHDLEALAACLGATACLGPLTGPRRPPARPGRGRPP